MNIGSFIHREKWGSHVRGNGIIGQEFMYSTRGARGGGLGKRYIICHCGDCHLGWSTWMILRVEVCIIIFLPRSIISRLRLTTLSRIPCKYLHTGPHVELIKLIFLGMMGLVMAMMMVMGA